MTRPRVRAAALAAIMLASMVAVGAGFAGSAAAEDHTIVVSDDPGDGQYASIPAALDAAAPGDTISVQDDQVITSPDNRIVVDTNASGASLEGVSIVADGDVTVRYEQPDEEAPGVNPGYPTFDVQADNVTISGFTIELDTNDVYDGSERSAQAIKVGGFQASGGSGVEVTDNNISFVGADNDKIATTGVGLIDPNEGGQLAGATVSGNSIEVFNTGLFAFTTDDGLTGDFDVSDNEFQNNGVQYLDNSEQVDGGAVFEKNSFNKAAFPSNPANLDDVIHSSVQSAVDSSQSDATVMVDSGTYAENVTVDTGGLSLEGPNAGTPGHDGDRESEATVEGQVVVSADNVVFDGFDVSPPNASSNPGAEALRVSDSTDSVIVRNNVVRDFSEDELPQWEGIDGINVFGNDASDEVSNVTVADNLVEKVSGRSTDGGAAGISVQGNVEGADINDNVVRDIGQEDTAWAFGIVVRGTENHGETPSEVDVIENNIATVQSNPTTDTAGVGLGIESGDEIAVTFEDNTLSSTEYLLEDKTATVNLTAFADSNTLDRGVLLEEAQISDDTRNVVFNSVQDGLNSVSENQTISLLPGTYDSSATVDTAGVTIEGPNADRDGSSDTRTAESIISGQVDIDAPNVTVSGIQASPGTETFEDKPAAAVYISEGDATVENTRVADFGVNITEIGVSSVQGIHIYSADAELTDISVRNNAVHNVSYDGSSQAPEGGFGDDYGNLYGVHVQGEISDAVVRGNSLSNLHSDGYVLGAAVSGTGSNPEATPESVTVERNTFEDLSAEGAPATAFVVSSDRVDVSSLSISGNTFETPIAVASGASETVNATLNYFGNTTPTVQGDVTYDPFLTVEPDEVDADSLDETTQFGHDLVVPADGTPHSVAFPAPVNDTVTEVFGAFNGTVYAYDGDGWESGGEIADRNVGALDAFVVEVDEDEADLRVVFEYASSDAQYPTSADLGTGWNFVGAPDSGTSNEAFDVTTTDIATVSHINAGAGSQPYGVTATAPFATNPDDVSPFQGYWVFVTDDGELGATVPVGPTQSNEEGAVAGN
ncbi:surface glycoprotein [Halorubrum sp. 2020YC2]|uniref:surface glycoprotein n=1 Tax=Halorubrum sp. 2020YC2 TaxID=2836432 RepID=UPI001BE99CDB|nr:surface glycoprotein [Halorubrum sp. 2020YC2]QWC19409.1 surface glycoprotein [Halorubrum sp. 2020YC2]